MIVPTEGLLKIATQLASPILDGKELLMIVLSIYQLLS